VDVEVHGIAQDRLAHLLQELGQTRLVGRSFPVFKLRVGESVLDVSLPRADSRDSVSDPSLGLAEAARRRDLSINALAQDLLTEEIADPCGGLVDLEARRLRAAFAPRFGDDPLRALRAVRFAATLGFRPDRELVALCQAQDLRAEPVERVRRELVKMLLNGPASAWALGFGQEAGVWGQILPEVEGCDLDALAACLARIRRDTVTGQGAVEAVHWAVLLSPAGEGRAEGALDRLRLVQVAGYPVRQQVRSALRAQERLASDPSDADLRRLAEDTDLPVALAVAEALGTSSAEALRERASWLGVFAGPLPALVTGRKLASWGVPHGPEMGETLRAVRAAQLAGEVEDEAGARRLVMRLWSIRS
jgi:tRNA nucleotidyltransferase/poly(A) polymerase